MPIASSSADVPQPRQDGSVLVIMTGALLILLVLLGSIQLGYAFSVKRELQKTADLAALSGVQALKDGTECAAAKTRAQDIAAANMSNLDAVTAECGHWEIPSNYVPGADTATFFNSTSATHNSLKVKINKKISTIVPFLALDTDINGVTATAVTTDPVAAFSVGSRLLSVRSDGLLGSLLSTVGLSPDTLTVLDSDGLANARISPAGLLEELGLPATVALGVGTPDEVLKLSQLTLADILNAAATVAGPQLLQADVDALKKAINATLAVSDLNVPVKLFGEGGIFAVVDTTDPAAALQAVVGLSDLVSTGVLVANGKNMVNLSLNNVAFIVEGGIQIIEPPSIAIGGIGAEAHSAQIRIYLLARTDSIPVVGPLLRTTGTFVNLPIIIEVAQSKGTLTNVCAAPLTTSQAEIEVTTSAVNLCIGRFQDMDAGGNGFLSATNMCSDNVVLDPTSTELTPDTVMNVLGILPVNSRVALSLLSSSSPAPRVMLTAPPSVHSTETVPNSKNLDLADTASSVADAILGGLLGEVLGSSSGMSSDKANKLAEELVGMSGNGRPIADVVAKLKWSQTELDTLAKRLTTGGLTGVLGGTLQAVGNVLNTILLAPLGDVYCGLTNWTSDQLRTCRVNTVKTLALSGNNLLSGVAAITIALLEPLLDPLSLLLQQLLNTLGLNLGETDVALHSVQCGIPRLVD